MLHEQEPVLAAQPATAAQLDKKSMLMVPVWDVGRGFMF